jgi:hypothetical protein
MAPAFLETISLEDNNLQKPKSIDV